MLKPLAVRDHLCCPLFRRRPPPFVQGPPQRRAARPSVEGKEFTMPRPAPFNQFLETTERTNAGTLIPTIKEGLQRSAPAEAQSFDPMALQNAAEAEFAKMKDYVREYYRGVR